MSRVFEVSIAELPPTMNVIKRMHWAKYGRTRNQIAWLVRVALAGHQLPDDPIKRCEITVVRYARRLLDEDNLPSSAKIILDVLQPISKRNPSGIGVIYSDAPEFARVHVKQEKVGKADVRMVVRIEELAA
mgnify:FL=1